MNRSNGGMILSVLALSVGMIATGYSLGNKQHQINELTKKVEELDHSLLNMENQVLGRFERIIKVIDEHGKFQEEQKELDQSFVTFMRGVNQKLKAE